MCSKRRGKLRVFKGMTDEDEDSCCVKRHSGRFLNGGRVDKDRFEMVEDDSLGTRHPRGLKGVVSSMQISEGNLRVQQAVAERPLPVDNQCSGLKLSHHRGICG